MHCVTRMRILCVGCAISSGFDVDMCLTKPGTKLQLHPSRAPGRDKASGTRTSNTLCDKNAHALHPMSGLAMTSGVHVLVIMIITIIIIIIIVYLCIYDLLLLLLIFNYY